jgi:hypothetical protein
MTPEDYTSALSRIEAMPDSATSLPGLWDLRRCDFGNITGYDVRTLVRLKGRNAFRRAARSAIVVNSEVGFGMARMFQIQQDVEKVADESAVGIFHDVDEAVTWLLQ